MDRESKTINLSDCMTTAEVADRCKVKPVTVQRWVQNGNLKPALKQYNLNFFLKADVEAWEAKRKPRGRPRDTGDDAALLTRDDQGEDVFYVTLKGWEAYSKRRRFADIPTSEIFERWRPIKDEEGA